MSQRSARKFTPYGPTAVLTSNTRRAMLSNAMSYDNSEDHAHSLGTVQCPRNAQWLLISALVAAPIPPRGQPLDNRSENRAASNPPDAARYQPPALHRVPSCKSTPRPGLSLAQLDFLIIGDLFVDA